MTYDVLRATSIRTYPAPPPLQNIFSPSMKCGGWSQFDPKFSDPALLNAFMDDAAAAAANRPASPLSNKTLKLELILCQQPRRPDVDAAGRFS